MSAAVTEINLLAGESNKVLSVPDDFCKEELNLKFFYNRRYPFSLIATHFFYMGQIFL